MIQNMIDFLPKPKLQRLKEMEKEIEKEQRELNNRRSIALFARKPSVMYGRYPGDEYNPNAESERKERIKRLKEELYQQQERTYQSLPEEVDYRNLSLPLSGQEERYRYINKQNEFENPKINPLAPKTGADKKHGLYRYLKPEEINRYNYIHAKAGEEEAERYLRFMEESLNERMGDKTVELVGDNTVSKVAFSLPAGTMNWVHGMQQNFSPEKALPTSPAAFASGKIRSTLNGTAGFFYDAGHSVGNMAPSILASTVTGAPLIGAAMMGLGAKGNAQSWALKNGFSPEEASNYGILIGLSETMLEKVLGGITKLGGGMMKNAFVGQLKAIDSGLIRFVSKVGASAFSEGLEEGVQEVLEPVFQSIALGEEYTPAELSDVVYAALLGAFTGGLFESIEAGQEGKAMNAYGKAIKAQGEGAALGVIRRGLETNPEGIAYRGAEKMQGQLKKGVPFGELSNYNLARTDMESEAALRAGDTKENRLRDMGEMFGRAVEFFDEADSGTGIRNGYFKDGKIYINRQSKNPMTQVFSHELTHSLEGARGYQELAGLVRDALSANGNLEQAIIDKQFQYYQSGVELTEAEAMAELVAEYVEKNLFTNEKQVRTLVKKNRSLGVRIANWLSRTLDMLRAKFGDKKAEERLFLNRAQEVYRRALSEDNKPSFHSVEGKYSIKKDNSGREYVEIDKDILQGVLHGKEEQAVVNFLKNEFSGGITINGKIISVNKITRNEVINSKYAQNVKNDPKRAQIYADRFRFFGNTDELLAANSGFVKEPLTKVRKDNFVDFEKAEVLVKVNGRDYKAKIVVGIKDTGQHVLYDIVTVKKTNILPQQTTKTLGAAGQTINSQPPSRVSSKPSIPRQGGNVKQGNSDGQLSISPVAQKNKSVGKPMSPQENKRVVWKNNLPDTGGISPVSPQERVLWQNNLPDTSETPHAFIKESIARSGRDVKYSLSSEKNKSARRPVVQTNNTVWNDTEEMPYAFKSMGRQAFTQKSAVQQNELLYAGGVPHAFDEESIARSGQDVKYSLSNYDEEALPNDMELWDDDVWEIMEESTSGRMAEHADLSNTSERSKKILEREGRRLKRAVKKLLGASRFSDDAAVDTAIKSLTAEYVKTGEVKAESMKRTFDTLYNETLIREDRFYKENRQIRDEIRSARLTISREDSANIPDFNKFRQRALWAVRIAKEGLPVDVFYQEMAGRYPHLFPTDITRPADQLLHIYSVADSIRVTEIKIKDFWGDGPEFMEAARRDFEVEVKNMTAKLNHIQRYEADIEAWERKRGTFSDFDKLEENLAEVKVRQKKLAAWMQKVKKTRLRRKMDQEILSNFIEGKINREMVEQQTDNAETIFALADKSRRLSELNRDLKKLNKMKRYQEWESEKEAARKEREWIREPLKTKEDVDKLRQERSRLKAAFDKATVGRKFTAQEMALLNKLIEGSITIDFVSRNSDRAGDIFHAYNVHKRLEPFNKKYEKYLHGQRIRFDKEAAEDLEAANWREWKDKKAGILYRWETTLRNIEDIIPNQDMAARVYDKYFGGISRKEAEANHFKNQYAERVKALHLSRKVKAGDKISESSAVQFLGEAKYYMGLLEKKPLLEKAGGFTMEEWNHKIEELITGSKGLDSKKIDRAIEEFSKIYDELFPLINEALIENGYEAMEYRQGYFPHFSEDRAIVDFVEEMKSDISALFLQSEAENLPTEINGKTHIRKPGKRWFSAALKRMGTNTVYDAVQGFDWYIAGAAHQIYHTENILRLRALERQIRYKTTDEAGKAEMDKIKENLTLTAEQREELLNKVKPSEKMREHLSNFAVWLTEYTNLLAGKNSFFDRIMQNDFSRAIYTASNKWMSRIAKNQIAGNLASAATNVIPIFQSSAELSWGEIIAGIESYRQSLKVEGGDEISRGSIFLINRRGYDHLAQSFSEEWANRLSLPMNMIDTFTSESIVRARYFQNIKRGMSKETALANADTYAAKIIADRSFGMTPTLFAEKRPLVRLLTMYQLEIKNQLSYLFKDLPRAYRDRSAKELALAYVKYFLSCWLLNEIYQKIFGRRPAPDPVGIVNEAIGDFTGYRLPNILDAAEDWASGREVSFTKKQLRVSEATINLGKNLAEEVPFVGSLFGGGRVPVSSAVPGLNLLKVLDKEVDERKKRNILGKELSKPLFYGALPFGGGQLKKMAEGAYTVMRGGDYGVDSNGHDILNFTAQDKNPVQSALRFGQNIIGGRMANREAREWIENDFQGLNGKQTEVFKKMVEAGADGRDAFGALKKISKVKKMDGETTAAAKVRLIEGLSLSGEAKAELYIGSAGTEREAEYFSKVRSRGGDISRIAAVLMELRVERDLLKDKEILLRANLSLAEKERLYREVLGTESEGDSIDEYQRVGLSITDYLKAKVAYKKADQEYENKKDKALAVASYINKQDYTPEQKAFLRQKMAIRGSMPIAPRGYDTFLAAGLSEDVSYRISEVLNHLDPEEGKGVVSRAQQWGAVLSMELATEDKEAAIFSLFNDGQKERVETGRLYGVTAMDYARYLKLLNEANVGDTVDQREAAAVIRKMMVSMRVKAALWQMQNKSWKGTNNPFDRSIGQRVSAALKRKKLPKIGQFKPVPKLTNGKPIPKIGK